MYVTRGSDSATMPDNTPVRVPESREPSTTIPATAIPTAIALGNRTENADAPNSCTQK